MNTKKLKSPTRSKSLARPKAPARPRLITKNQLIKELKERGNFNYTFTKELDIFHALIWKVGSYDEISIMREKTYENYKTKFRDLMDSVNSEFAEYREKKELEEMIEYTREEIINYGKDPKPMLALFDAIVKKYGVSLLALNNLDIQKDFDYKLNAEEFISITVRASVWTYYVEGTINLLGNKKGERCEYHKDRAVRL